jgi:hypothetical protein
MRDNDIIAINILKVKKYLDFKNGFEPTNMHGLFGLVKVAKIVCRTAKVG